MVNTPLDKTLVVRYQEVTLCDPVSLEPIIVTYGYSNTNDILTVTARHSDGAPYTGNISLLLDCSTVTAGGGGGNNTVGISNLGNTAGVSGVVTGLNIQYALAGGNNITLSQNIVGHSGTVTISAGTVNPMTVSAGARSSGLGSLVFANSNNVSFGLLGSTITATVAAITSQFNQAVSGSNGSFSFQTLSFGNSNNVSFYTTNGSIVASGAGGGGGGGTISVVGSSLSLGQVVFSNSNGVTFGLNGSTLTASVSAAGGGGTLSFAGSSASLGQLVFSNSNGVSFGLNGSTVTGSVQTNYLTSQSNQALSAGNGSFTFQTASLADSNGVSFSTGTQGVYATVKTDYLTSQSNQAFSAQGGSSTFQTLTFTNSNGFSFSNTGGSIWGSYTVPSTAGLISNINVSAGTTSNNLSAFTFSNSNGVSFGLDGSTVTATVKTDYLTSQSNQAVSAGNGSFTFQTLSLTDSNGVSFSTGTQGIYATVKTDYLTSQSNQAFSAQGGSSTFQTLNFTNSNGFSFSNTGGSIWGSYTVPTVTNSSWTVSDNATSGTVARLAFTNLNGVTLSLSSGTGGLHTIVGSVNAQSNIAFSAQGGSSTFQTLNFTNSNGFSFSNTGGSIWGSYTVPTVTNSSMTVSDANTSGTLARLAFTNLNGMTLSLSTGAGGSHTIVGSYTVPTQTNQTIGIYASSNTTSSVSSGTLDARSLTFVGAGNVSVGYSNGSVIMSGATAATVIAISGGTSSANLGSIVFSNSNNVSFGLNGSTMTASVNPGTLSFYQNIAFEPMITGASALTQTSGSSIFIQPFVLQNNVSLSYVRLLGSFNDSAVGTAGTTSLNTNFSCERYTTIGLVVYSQGVGASSRSIQSIASTSVGITGRTIFSMGNGGGASSYTITIQKTYPATGANNNQYTTSYNVNSASIVISSNSNTLFTGPRFIDIPFATSFSNGNYWLGIGASTNSSSQTSHISFVGTAGMPVSLAAVSISNVSVGILGAATSASDNQLIPGLGMWSTNASVFTQNSIGLNSISQLTSNIQLPFQFIRQA